MKINEKKSRRAEQLGQPAGRPKTVREASARINKKHLVMLIVNCVVFIGLYRLFMNAAFEFTVQKVVVLTYMIGASVLILAYVIYNRGFSLYGFPVASAVNCFPSIGVTQANCMPRCQKTHFARFFRTLHYFDRIHFADNLHIGTPFPMFFVSASCLYKRKIFIHHS